MIAPAAIYHRIARMQDQMIELLLRLPVRQLLDTGVMDLMLGNCDQATRARIMALIEVGVDDHGRMDYERLTDAERRELHTLITERARIP